MVKSRRYLLLSSPCSLAACLSLIILLACQLMHENKLASCLHIWILGAASLKAFFHKNISLEIHASLPNVLQDFLFSGLSRQSIVRSFKNVTTSMDLQSSLRQSTINNPSTTKRRVSIRQPIKPSPSTISHYAADWCGCCFQSKLLKSFES